MKGQKMKKEQEKRIDAAIAELDKHELRDEFLNEMHSYATGSSEADAAYHRRIMYALGDYSPECSHAVEIWGEADADMIEAEIEMFLQSK